MNFSLLKDMIQLLEQFESDPGYGNIYSADRDGMMQWLHKYNHSSRAEPEWEGKEKGRSAESMINTLIVHLNRYARTYAKSAIWDSDFATQEEFIYLINLRSLGAMSKMELIKKNIHDKPVGMKIIERLLNQGWIEQSDSVADKRSKIISVTARGLEVLEQQMDKIRQASLIVTGDLDHSEKMELIRLLSKLDNFHKPIFSANIDSGHLLEKVLGSYLSNAN